MNRKTITIDIANEQLDALEDLLTVELSPKEEKKLKAKVMALWKELARAYDDATHSNDTGTEQ